jgi:uncharacterized repeat protein (TIGR03943 family)
MTGPRPPFGAAPASPRFGADRADLVTTRTQAFILMLFGGALLRLATSTALSRYVRPVSRPWVLLAAVSMVLLAGWTLVSRARSGAPRQDDGHGHAAASRAAWLALAPVIAILVIAPPALGSYSASRLPVRVAKPADVHFPSLPTGDPIGLSMGDFFTRAIWDDGRTLASRHVSLTGFVLRSEQHGFLIARLVITCCAADARSIDVGVETPQPSPAVDSWVTVTGTYAGRYPGEASLPALTGNTVTQIAQPANPYG